MFRRIEFAPNEILAIEPYLKDEHFAPETPNYVPVNRRLILLFGTELETGHDVNIPILADELWQLREIIPIGLKDSYGKPVGFNIKKKIYAALQSIDVARIEVECQIGFKVVIKHGSTSQSPGESTSAGAGETT